MTLHSITVSTCNGVRWMPSWRDHNFQTSKVSVYVKLRAAVPALTPGIQSSGFSIDYLYATNGAFFGCAKQRHRVRSYKLGKVCSSAVSFPFCDR